MTALLSLDTACDALSNEGFSKRALIQVDTDRWEMDGSPYPSGKVQMVGLPQPM